ncbi:MAG: hypothetical protein SGJ18_01100 [Pseudomonadota bacterium]|nr:hypothetical protein [Pseudomonadota bacterium]
MRQLFCLIILMFGIPGQAVEISATIKGIDGLKVEKVTNAYLNELALKPGLLIMDAATALTNEASQIQIHDLKTSKTVGKQAFKAPSSCQHFATTQEPGRALRGLYCFTGKGKGDSLQLYQGKGKFAPILKTPNPITAIAGGYHRLFFLSGDAIYVLREGDKIRPVFVSSFLTGVRSMAFDGESDLLFLATDKEVYSLRAGTLDLLVQGLGGNLAWIKSDLFVSNSSGVYRLPAVRDLLVVKK